MTIRTFQGITPKLGAGVYVDPMALVLGDVALGADSSVWPGAVVRGDVNSIRIGERCSIQDGSVLHVTHAGKFNPAGCALTLGNDITVGHSVNLHGCTLQNRILVGIGSTILDKVTVESGVVIGAGSLVPPGKTLEGGYLYVGSPVKQVRKLSQQELDFFTYSAANYVALKNKFLAENYTL